MSELFVQQYETVSGHQIFQIPTFAFPGFMVNVFVVFAGEYLVLIDTGSGFGEANADLESGVDQIGHMINNSFSLESITHVLMTHAHIDHFGGLPFVLEHSNAKVGIHEYDRRILAHYEESLALASMRLEQFFIEAGVNHDRVIKLLDLYRINKELFHSIPVDFTYADEGMQVGPFEIIHVPGHTAGHVMFRIDGMVFAGDHILEDISPHQAPEQLTLSTGISHYVASLRAAQSWLNDDNLIFTGHKGPLRHGKARIDAIIDLHKKRLADVLALCREPITISEISQRLFRDVSGYNVLLALEETGAHVEYLYQIGLLKITNIDEVEKAECSLPIHYIANSTTDYQILI
jgi:glyoxylase-like metal-dependent hydrolase (beta-lactamase superfamily II)